MAHPIDKEQEDVSFFDRGIGAVAKKTGQGAMWTLGKYGEGLDWTNEQVKLRNTPLGTLAKVTGLDKNKYVSGALDYSYGDLREDAAEGAGDVTEWGLKKIGYDENVAANIGKGVEVAGQILIPDAVDYLGGVGYLDNLARASKKLPDLAGGIDKLSSGLRKVDVPNPLSPRLAMAGGPNINMRQADQFTPANTFAIKSKKSGGFKQQPRDADTLKLIDANKKNKPDGFDSRKWDNWIAKFGSLKGTQAAMKKADESAAYLKKHGSLKGNNNIWIDPVSGESFLVNNKTSRAAKLRGDVNINFDSIKSIERTLAKRLTKTKLDKKEIKKIGKELGWDKTKINEYIATNEQAARTLKALIKDLNKGENRTMWSLGHRTAAEELPHSADRALNIELEPLVDVVTKEGRTILGNTGRAAHDELIDLFKKITNNPVDLESDMIHWGDSLVGNFMPRMREITDAKSFFKEIVKREDYLNAIRDYSKANKVSLEEAADIVMEPLMKKYPKLNEPTYFEPIQEMLGRITNAQVAVSSNGFAAQ